MSVLAAMEEFKNKTPLEVSDFLQEKGIPLDVCDVIEGETESNYSAVVVCSQAIS